MVYNNVDWENLHNICDVEESINGIHDSNAKDLAIDLEMGIWGSTRLDVHTLIFNQ